MKADIARKLSEDNQPPAVRAALIVAYDAVAGATKRGAYECAMPAPPDGMEPRTRDRVIRALEANGYTVRTSAAGDWISW